MTVKFHLPSDKPHLAGALATYLGLEVKLRSEIDLVNGARTREEACELCKEFLKTTSDPVMLKLATLGKRYGSTPEEMRKYLYADND